MRDGLQIFVTPADTLRVAFMRIDFLTDRGGAASTGNGRFDLSGPDTLALPIDPPPHNRTFFSKHLEALGRFHDAQSYQRTIVVGDVWPRDRDTARITAPTWPTSARGRSARTSIRWRCTCSAPC